MVEYSRPVAKGSGVLEAAMPSATLSAVFAQRYGCDAGLASLLIFSTVVLSFLTIMGVLGLV